MKKILSSVLVLFAVAMVSCGGNAHTKSAAQGEAAAAEASACAGCTEQCDSTKSSCCEGEQADSTKACCAEKDGKAEGGCCNK